MAKNKMTPFQQALVTAVLEEYKDIPQEDALQLSFSPAFEESMRPLVEPRRWAPAHGMSKTLRRVILIAVLLAALATTVLAVPSVREAVIKFFVTESKNRYHITFDPQQATDAPNEIETVYAVTYVPDGYKNIITQITSKRVRYEYYAEDSSAHIAFYQHPIPEDLQYTRPRSPESQVEKVYLEGQEFTVFHCYDTTDYVWSDNEYLYMLTFQPTVSESIFLDIYHSIQKNEHATIRPVG